jgi:UvrD-like helicase C-terminal domain/AAA domain
VWCDEFGMIGEDDSRALLSNSYDHQTIFLGDTAQLPPIGEENSFIGSLLDMPETRLTEIMRYKGDILDVAASYIGKINLPGKKIESKDGSIITFPSKIELMSVFAEDVEIGLEIGDTDYTKMICYTNKAAQMNSQWVRDIVLNQPNLPYIAGDRLLAKKPIQVKNMDGVYQILIENSMEFTVIKDCLSKHIKIGDYTYEYWQVLARADTGLEHELKIIKDGQEKLFNEHLAHTKSCKKWSVFHDLTKFFDSICYAYCVTCHKAQGSTYQYVHLDLPDLNKCRDKKRMLYTAITRTSKVLNVF